MAFRSDQAGYEGGKTDILNLIDSERVYLNAKIVYYQVLAETLKNFAAIERITGMGLLKENDNKSPQGVGEKELVMKKNNKNLIFDPIAVVASGVVYVIRHQGKGWRQQRSITVQCILLTRVTVPVTAPFVR